ncbi:MAG: response regulator [Elusimicrobia bacterium]|nr:response regulator [Elusimicrobiota bacterium]
MTERANILVVEDNEVLAEFIGDELRDNGYGADVVHTGKEAIERVKTGIFDVALLDIKLPDIKGTEVLVKLKEINPNIVCIMMTGNTNIETTIDSLRGGAQDYLLKPIDLNHLVNITKKAVKKLRILQAQLLKSERLAALGKMAAVVAHEIRNPIASIRASAQRISKQFSASDLGNNKYIRYIIEETDRLGSVVKNILTFSKSPEPHLIPNDINKLINDVLYFLSAEIKLAKVKITKKLEQSLPMVSFDQSLIRQVLLNIFQNALFFMSYRDKKELKVATMKRGSNVVVEISDTGSGIPKENMVKIFEPFFSTKPSGTGLGLATSQKIIKSHNGDLQVESEPDYGTTFKILLPV